MEQILRFLEHLERVLGELPYAFTEGVGGPLDKQDKPDGCMWEITAIDTTVVRREYAALPEPLKDAIEPEWMEFGVLMDNANAMQQESIELFRRMVLKIGDALGVDWEADDDADAVDFDDAPTDPFFRHNGRTRLAVVLNEVMSDDLPAVEAAQADSGSMLLVGSPVSSPRQTLDERDDVALAPLPVLPNPDASIPVGARRRRVGVAGVALGAVAGVALAIVGMLASDSQPDLADEATSTVTPAPTPLPITEYGYPAFDETPTETERPAPAIATSLWRKASKAMFIRDTDTVFLIRDGKPSLQVTITEVSGEAVTNAAAKQRTHSVDMERFSKIGLEFGVRSDVRVTMEFE